MTFSRTVYEAIRNSVSEMRHQVDPPIIYIN